MADEKPVREKPARAAVSERPEPLHVPSDPLAGLPSDEKHRPGAALFLDACQRLGINPAPDVKPREIGVASDGKRFRYRSADPHANPPQPERVVFVTMGGVKIVWPIDQDTEESLKRWHGCYRIDKVTKQLVSDPLPENLTLPPQAITGQVPRSASGRRQPGQ